MSTQPNVQALYAIALEALPVGVAHEPVRARWRLWLALGLLLALLAGGGAWTLQGGDTAGNAYGGECVDSECWAPGRQAVPNSYPCAFNGGVDTCWQASGRRVTEDSPQWNCRTMGNHICGKGVKP